MALQSRTEIHINLDKAIEALSTDDVLKVGWVSNKRYPEKQGGLYVAEVAARNEYGYSVPPRPFMGPAVENNKNKWSEIINRGAIQAVEGNTNILDTLKIVGAVAAEDIKKSIRDVVSPSLAPATIAKRLRKLSKKVVTESLTKPLIDTKLMFQTVSYAVEKE